MEKKGFLENREAALKKIRARHAKKKLTASNKMVAIIEGQAAAQLVDQLRKAECFWARSASR